MLLITIKHLTIKMDNNESEKNDEHKKNMLIVDMMIAIIEPVWRDHRIPIVMDIMK